MQSVRNECLDHFLAFGEGHLEYLLQEYEEYYNTARPHQGIGNRTIGVVTMPLDSGPPDPARIECESRLGGLLRHYHRRTA